MHLALQIWTSLEIPNLSGFFLMKNKFKDSYRECLNKLICSKILTTKTLGVNVYKMFKCDKKQVRVAQKWQES
jgi:hypothetical protein